MIQFTNDIQEDKLRMAYNNDVVEFYSDNTAPARFADITTDLFSLRIYPSPDNKFYFNFLKFASASVNTRNFQDTLSPNLPTAYIYDMTAGTILNLDVNFKISLDDEAGTTEDVDVNLTWLAGVMQLNDYVYIDKNEILMLSTFKRATTNHYYLKYWEGYPFDISVLSEQQLYLLNETTLMEWMVNPAGQISRIVFSDGRTDTTLESVLPLIEGYNNLRIMTSPDRDDEKDKFVLLEKAPYACGVYFKWFNKLGGYSYWLFENTYSLDRSSKALNEIQYDDANLENSYGRTLQIGRESKDTIRVIAELLTEEQRMVVEGILESPKVYLFTGAPFSQNFANDWIEVSLKSNGARIKNPRQSLTNLTFDFELPDRYTQIL